MNVDPKILRDLTAFARIEVAANDIEPWAAVIRMLTLPRDSKIWLSTLYNTYDDLHSAWNCMILWPTPQRWAKSVDRHRAAEFPCTQERRNLRGGRVLQRFASYASLLGAHSEESWMRPAIDPRRSPGENFAALTTRMRGVWGVGRQSAFEWAEFMIKVGGFMHVDAADGQLWESSGPRRSLEDLFGLTDPSARQLDDAANITRDYLFGEGIDLSWLDFETVICDFLVMRRGRYYPGRHLAALRDEIWTLPDPADQEMAKEAWYRAIPAPWADIPLGGIQDRLQPVYRATGQIIDNPHW